MRAAVRETGGRKVVLGKFLGKEILGEWGRLLFSLLNNFALCGYEVRLWDSFSEPELGKYGLRVRALPNFSLVTTVSTDAELGIYIYDEEDPAIGRLPWRKKVKVRFDVFSSYLFSDPIIMPYPVHPVHAGPDLRARLEAARTESRKMRAFFSGETAGYIRNRIQYPKAKLLRTEAMDVLSGALDGGLEVVRDEEALNVLFRDIPYAAKFVLGQPGAFRVDERNWLRTLARADFFLCLPGYVMPMCHNAAESMAVGTVPIINYPEWFDPTLEHMRNCIVFDDAADLIKQVKEVLRMSHSQVLAMRRNVLDYYDRYLSPSAFVERIESRKEPNVTVLLVTDANTTKNGGKLGPRSVLIRGTASGASRGWAGRLGAAFAGTLFRSA